MVTVTARACEQLKATLTANADEPGVGLRLRAVAPGQLGFILDQEREGDQVVEHDGATVLLVGEELSEPLAGMTIDCEETPQGTQLVLSGPPPGSGGEPAPNGRP